MTVLPSPGLEGVLEDFGLLSPFSMGEATPGETLGPPVRLRRGCGGKGQHLDPRHLPVHFLIDFARACSCHLFTARPKSGQVFTDEETEAQRQDVTTQSHRAHQRLTEDGTQVSLSSVGCFHFWHVPREL